MLEGEDNGNNETEENDPTLLRMLINMNDVNSKQKVSYVLSSEQIEIALSKELDVAEENCIEYVSGYFFKRLLSLHKNACETCSKLAVKLNNQTQCTLVSDIFLYFKRYDTDKATLYKCHNSFVDFVTSVIKVASFAYEHHPSQEDIIALVVNSCLSSTNCSNFMLCEPEKVSRIAHIIARTILFYKSKWANDKMKKTEPKNKKSVKQKKIEKLSHK